LDSETEAARNRAAILCNPKSKISTVRLSFFKIVLIA
jgi:hypothetical protein